MKTRYDLILVDQPGPASLQLNRFYSREFFLTARSRLNPGGILALVLNGPSEMIGIRQSATFQSLYNTLRTVFPKILFFPGEELSLLGFRNEPPEAISSSLLISRLSQRALRLDYLNPLQIQAILSSWRLGYFQEVFLLGRTDEVNRDLKPVSFFNQLRSDLALQHPRLAACFAQAGTVPVSLGMGLVLLIWGVLLIRTRFFHRSGPYLPVLSSIGVSGFSAMALEILIVVLFQIGLGVLYWEIGLLMAFFMMGLAGGAYVILSRKSPSAGDHRFLIGFQGVLAIFFLFLILPAKQIGVWPEGLLKVFFYGSMTLGGALSGALYALCSKAYYFLGKGLGRTAGTLYGLDLLGAALASLIIPFVALPSWGMIQVLFFLFLINGLAAVLIGADKNLFLDKG